MQKAPLLLSSAKMGVPHEEEHHQTTSAGAIVLAVVVAFFVLVGMFDMVGRVFASGAPKESAEVKVANLVTSRSETSDQVHTQTQPFTPKKISIPSLDIDATVEAVGLNARGEMQTPSSFKTTSWYKLGSRPGEAGNTVIAGHFNSPLIGSGVFEHLNELTLGDKITITGEGTEITYVVQEMYIYPADGAPKDEIFSTEGESKLMLITCDGAWDAGTKHYDKRLVVVAVPL